MHGLMSYRRFGRARSLRSDRAEHAFGRCVATLFELLFDAFLVEDADVVDKEGRAKVEEDVNFISGTRFQGSGNQSGNINFYGNEQRKHTVQLGGWKSWIDQTTSSADGRAGSTKRPGRPSAKLNQSSSADGRAGSSMRPARPSAELNQSSLADGQTGSNTRPARPSAKLGNIQFHPDQHLLCAPSTMPRRYTVHRAGGPQQEQPGPALPPFPPMPDMCTHPEGDFQCVVVDALTAIWARISRCRCSTGECGSQLTISRRSITPVQGRLRDHRRDH
ncbi:hypothetical protein F2Q69_00022649 [Brassica cretica]|uniref:Uncharacterized protein n=1 Tax=Brassica cretica TaxID=69181 RepID=A0A8S9QS19_BRACR|nr:hypothetical protein F2Q69_00022649 [Brassica cretica]